MPIFDLFSKRQKQLRGETPDVFKYDELPMPLRVQIVHIIRDAVGRDPYGDNTRRGEVFQDIHDALCREYGFFTLTDNNQHYETRVCNFFLNENDIERALDVVQVCFDFIENIGPQDDAYMFMTERKLDATGAVGELNYRFRQAGVGYQFESGKIIRMDSEYVHSEVIRPALHYLSEKDYRGANEEFLRAHEHYRHGRYKETLVEALKAFESTMKIICTKHKWAFKDGDAAKRLLEICFENELIPGYLQSQFSSLRSILESGVPTVRNKLGGHGQGSETTTVSLEMARYALNLTAANIVFLVEHEKLISK